MIPSRLVWDSMQNLLAADPLTLSPAAAENKVTLIVAPFTPAFDLDVAGLAKATFAGSTPLSGVTGPQRTYVDVTSGMSVIELIEPEGGWLWECTAAPAAAETIYGYIVTDDAGTKLIGSGLLPNAVTIDAAGQGLSIDKIQLRFTTGSPF